MVRVRPLPGADCPGDTSQYPTLTDEGFTTEVHHVDGQGENAGVVYAEMQARENGSSDLMALQCVRRLWKPADRSHSSQLITIISLAALQASTDDIPQVECLP